MTGSEVLSRYPAPWRYVATGGNVQLFDALGKEVPLFMMLDFIVSITAGVAARAAQATQAG